MKRKLTAVLLGGFAASTMFAATAHAERIDPNNPGPKDVAVKPIHLIFPQKVCTTHTLAPWDDGPPIVIESCKWKCPAGSIPIVVIGDNELLCRDF